MALTEADHIDNQRVVGAVNVLIKEMRTSERELEQAIDQRDAAEGCLSQMYYLVTGNSPQWSNKFGHEQALEDVGDVMAALKAVARLPQVTTAPEAEHG